MPTINYFNQNNNSEFKFILADAGTDVKVNGQPKRILITNTGLDTKYDDKKISSMEQVGTGDLIEFANRKWLVVSEVNGLRYDHYKGIIRLCDYNIKFNINCKVYEFPAIIESSKFSVMSGNVMIVPDDVIKVTVQENADTLKIQRDQRFIKLSNAWKVTGIDRTQKGLITFTCEFSAISAQDDMLNEIADKCNVIYTVEILNGVSSNLDVNGTLQMNTKVTANGTVATMPVVYESSDTTIATVDANGLIKGLKQGTVTITVRLQEDTSIFDTITIEVKPLVILDNWSIVIDGVDSITRSTTTTKNTATYTARFLNNGVEVSNSGKAVKWTIVSTTETTGFSTIKSQTGTSCVVESGTTAGKSITLRATMSNDSKIYTDKVIAIKGVF